MNLSHRIQAKTDNGDLIIDFLIGVMTGDVRDDFKLCHQLQAARLLTNHGCSCLRSAAESKSAGAERDQAIDFILHNLPEPSLYSASTNSPDDSEFDQALARKIQESTDDGATVCRFLINVMEGQLKAFKPHHRITAARELLDRGFGKQATSRHSGEEPVPYSIRDRNPEGTGRGENQDHQPTPPHTSQPSTQPTKSEKSPNPTNQSSDTPDDWSAFNELIDAAKEESDRILAEQGIDPNHPPHKPDYSAFDAAMENSHRWFHEWKNSIDPEEYQAIIKQTAERFDARIDRRIERRKQIKADRERREKEEAEREAQQAKARAEAKEKADAESAAAEEEEALGPPPSREEHERWSPTPSIPTSFRLVKCGHPKCKLHDGPVYYPEDDRSSPYYWNGQQPLNFRTYPF